MCEYTYHFNFYEESTEWVFLGAKTTKTLQKPPPKQVHYLVLQMLCSSCSLTAENVRKNISNTDFLPFSTSNDELIFYLQNYNKTKFPCATSNSTVASKALAKVDLPVYRQICRSPTVRTCRSGQWADAWPAARPARSCGLTVWALLQTFSSPVKTNSVNIHCELVNEAH